MHIADEIDARMGETGQSVLELRKFDSHHGWIKCKFSVPLRRLLRDSPVEMMECVLVYDVFCSLSKTQILMQEASTNNIPRGVPGTGLLPKHQQTHSLT